MEVRHGVHPEHAKTFDTGKMREEFLVRDLFRPGKLKLVYSHIDRIIVGGAVPGDGEILLEADRKTIGADYLLERRELGVLNMGGPGTVSVDGKTYELGNLEALYVGKGGRRVSFSGADPAVPAKFYLVCGQAHAEFPTRPIRAGDAKQVRLGSVGECNRRTIYQLIHPDVLPTCNLVMGVTRLEPGSVWNTMPCHTHQRRMEVYLYFDIPADAVVFHLMGEPRETRHIVVRDGDAVVSPSWSIHSGVGTRSYSFVWGMVGENQTFTDMDAVPMETLA